MAKANMKIWNSVCRPPESALKQIGAGRLKGMTDINPQWRIQALTETFGPCGLGWFTQIMERWVDNYRDQGEAVANVRVHLYVMHEGYDRWSSAIEGVGGSRLMTNESRGVYVSDEAWKMAETDAISVAAKKLGIAADIYAGRWDGTKYSTPAPAPVFTDAEIAEMKETALTQAKEGRDLKKWKLEVMTPRERELFEHCQRDNKFKSQLLEAVKGAAK